MCGLVGVIGDLSLEDKKAFDIMLKLDTVRGKHSTGVARVPWVKRDKVEVVKGIGSPYHLIDNKPNEYYNDYSADPGPYIQGNYIALMGHNRWATVGSVNEENAHPFEAGKIVGCQNGTLPQSAIRKLDDHEYYDTDTEALMFNIDLHGVEKVIPKIDGAWALTWYNKDEDSFNILRNSQRPLFFAWKKNKRVMYYASEAWMIHQATERFNIDLYEDEKGDDCWQFLKDVHYKFPFPKNMVDFKKETAWIKQELKGYEPPPVTYTKGNGYTVIQGGKSASASASVFKEALGNSVSSPMQSVEYWVGKKDQYVEFVVDGSVTKDEQRKDYIQAWTMNGAAPIRIYPSYKHPDLEFELGNPEVATFAGKIKKVKIMGNKGFYMTLDLDSIMNATYNGPKFKGIAAWASELKDADDDDIPWERIMSENKYDRLDEAEFHQKVQDGCAWCSCVPELYDAPNLHWIGSGNDFVCGDCAANDEVKPYLAVYS